VSDPAPQQQNDPVLKLFGAALMVVGLLMAALCGLCTAFGLMSLTFTLIGVFVSPNALAAFGAILAMVLFAGVLPTSVGVALYLWGRKLYNPAARPYFRRRPGSLPP
jgi:hypothetical protein